MERTRHASTTRFASQDLQTRDIDVCALLDSLVNTAKKVPIECSLVLFRCFLGNFANPWILKYFAKLRVSHFTSTFLFLRNIVFTPLRLAVEQLALHLSARISYDTKPSELWPFFVVVLSICDNLSDLTCFSIRYRCSSTVAALLSLRAGILAPLLQQIPLKRIISARFSPCQA